MKKILYTLLFTLLVAGTSSCRKDFLETSSPSIVDRDFVFSNEESARAALLNGYQSLHDNSELTQNGLFWGAIWGSDIEDWQEVYDEGNMEGQMKNFFPAGTANFNINSGGSTQVFGKLYGTIAIANSLIQSFEALSDFQEIMTGEPNGLSDVYGQAVTLRAHCYWELTRWYGDVPHALKAGEKAEGLTSRYAILDYHTQKLIEVEPHMYRAGEASSRADVMNRSYAQALIGRICLYNGGYATRRTDLGADFHTDGDGNVLTFEDWSVEKDKAIYGRRSDWRDVFAIGKKYLQMVADNSGSVVLHLTDPRGTGSNGQVYDNPYQYFFQQLHMGDDFILGDESLYEISYAVDRSTQRPGWIGRPSTGGNGQAPCISCGEERIQAHFYYGWYDNNDKRRDAATTVTGSTGQNTELVQSFDRSAWGKGCGPANNKWDWNRLPSPDTWNISSSGINFSYMRISDAYLMLAETAAALGDDATAKTWLGKVRHRNFPNGNDPNFDQYITDAGGLWRAVIKERALEFSGEGVRRFDLIRTGLLPEMAVENRRVMTAIVDGVQANGYYTFENGNQLPAYIWTKMVDARALYGHRLTASAAGRESDPVLFPGWRGQHDDWGSLYPNFAGVTKTNVAIKGLFKYIAPGSAEALALEADGYAQTPWAVDMPTYKDSYATKLLAGYSDADYAAKNPPMHVFPVTYAVLNTSGITNGYGFRQE